MFSTDFIFRQQENLVDNQKCQAGFRPLCNKILLSMKYLKEYKLSKRNMNMKLQLCFSKPFRYYPDLKEGYGTNEIFFALISDLLKIG